MTLEVECLDRMYLNVYQPNLQCEHDVFRFPRDQRGQGAVSSRCFAAMTQAFVQALDDFARDNGIPLIPFAKKQHKEEVAEGYRRPFQGTAGLLFIGKAQEKVTTFRTEGRRNAQIGQTYPWRVRTTALVNQYDCYSIDEDFGPFFLKFSSCFPYNAKRCINGHESVKRQRAKEGIAFEALDNGIRSCADPGACRRSRRA